MKTKLKKFLRGIPLGMTMASLALTPTLLRASSHMDAPLITLDPSANTTDVYAFLTSQDTNKYLTVALSVYPFEEPGIGPNDFRFDDKVLYEIHVATSNVSRKNASNDLALGQATLSYQFQFNTKFKNQKTILQAYTGVITNVDDPTQNLLQTYQVTKIDRRDSKQRKGSVLGTGLVPPNNQGIATPFYNQGDNGENLTKPGVATEGALDRYTMQTVTNLSGGYRAFAGQRDDAFYADIQSIFDLLQLRNPGKDSQGGFNVHTMVLQIPISELGGDQQVVGVYATTSRKSVNILRDLTKAKSTRLANNDSINATQNSVDNGNGIDENNRNRRFGNSSGRYVQVGRQGNPLFCEGLIALEDKDLYNRTSPTVDADLFRKYALNPELAGLLNALVGTMAITSNRTDIVGIFIPDLIKVDLSTGPARLTGGGSDDAGFSRLSVFGGDALTSAVQAGLPGFPAGTIPGGWPNGRRFGDDVVDIAVSALINDLRPDTFSVANGTAGDNVSENDIPYNKIFPYAATPHNGRNHTHH
ncbi:MAG: DUF4331 domain-containing protein [Verrucomicrobiota bacterium]